MTLADVRSARGRIAPFIRPTPLMRHPLLDAETGLELWVKHENHNPTGAFKVRGGLNLIGSLAPDARARGVVTASTGNHGQSIGMACREHGIACTVFVPEGNNPEKNADLTFDLMKRHLDDFMLLSEDELAEGVRMALRATHNLAEGAGAAALAAAHKMRDRYHGQRVVAIMSGGNLDAAKLRSIVAGQTPTNA